MPRLCSSLTFGNFFKFIEAAITTKTKSQLWWLPHSLKIDLNSYIVCFATMIPMNAHRRSRRTWRRRRRRWMRKCNCIESKFAFAEGGGRGENAWPVSHLDLAGVSSCSNTNVSIIHFFAFRSVSEWPEIYVMLCSIVS